MTVEFSEPILEYVKEHRNGILATNRKAGAPQLTMISYDYDGKDFAISTRAATQKAKNLSRRPDVALAVVEGARQLIVYGKATVVRDKDEVFRLHRDRMARGGRAETESELKERLEREERVIILLEPSSYFPSVLRATT
jgi:PPOX class probable F420-dependent enzyme